MEANDGRERELGGIASHSGMHGLDKAWIGESFNFLSKCIVLPLVGGQVAPGNCG